MAETQKAALLPPRRLAKYAYHHWVRRIDFDGHECGLEVYQWQPQTARWCRPNEYASKRDLDLVGYVWVAICPTPPFKAEVEEFKRALEFVSLNTDDPELRDTFSRLVREHIISVVQGDRDDAPKATG